MPKATKKAVTRKALQDYLDKNQIQKQQFAKMLNVSPAAISIWLYTNAMPAFPTLQRIAKSLGLSVDEVLDLFATADTEQPAKVPTLADNDNQGENTAHAKNKD